MSEKSYNEMTSQERFDDLVLRGVDPFGNGRAFCFECGYFPAFVPDVCVANRVTGEPDRYLLQIPHMCDTCAQKRGLTRHGYLIPKTKEFQNWTEACEEFLKDHPAWIEQLQEKSVLLLMEKYAMTMEDAKAMLGVK